MIAKIRKLTLMSCEELTIYAKAMPREYRDPILRELARRDQQQVKVGGGGYAHTTWSNPQVHIDPVRHSALYDLP